MTILYINYIDWRVSSGSAVRPTKMLEAFRQTGHKILELTGEQTSSTRRTKVIEMERRIVIERPDICYIESPVNPIFHRCDRTLIRKIHQMKIPIGFFYRDFYNKFRNLFPRREGIINYMKDLYWDYLSKKTDRVLNCCDIIYLPSEEAQYLFNYKDMRPLPPAGENRLIQNRIPDHTCFYVGGIIGPYNCNLLLETLDYMYQKDNSYHLILVARKNTWEKYQHPLKHAPWLEVHHVSGKELVPLYQRASLGFVVPRKDFSYNEFAVSVKLFEYMSYGLPAIAMNCAALSHIVENEGIGLTVNSTIEDMALKIQQLLDNPIEYNRVCNNIKKSLLERNLWKHRVDTIISDLNKKRIC